MAETKVVKGGLSLPLGMAVTVASFQAAAESGDKPKIYHNDSIGKVLGEVSNVVDGGAGLYECTADLNDDGSALLVLLGGLPSYFHIEGDILTTGGSTKCALVSVEEVPE